MLVEDRLQNYGQTDSGLSKQQRILFRALLAETNHRTGIYSIAPSHPALDALSGLTERELEQLCLSLSRAVGHPVNFFYYGRLPFIGFDYRRVDYARDERNGCNKVVGWIERGVYGRSTATSPTATAAGTTARTS